MVSRRPPLGFILMILLLALFAGGKAILYDTLDPDAFWHLRVAEQLNREGIGPLVDRISFVSSKQPWTPYSWLAELGMKAIWDWGGYRLAIVVQAAMQAAMVVLFAMCCLELQRSRRAGGERKYLAAVVATAVVSYFTIPYLSFRPVTAVLVLLGVCTWLILRDRRLDEGSKAVWLIVPLTVLATNIHLFAFFVPAAVLALLIGAIVERRNVRRYALLLLLSGLAFLATPMLEGVMKTIFFYGSRDVMVKSRHIAEMQSPFRGVQGAISGMIVGAIVLSAIVKYRLLRVGELICLCVSAILLFKFGRFFPVFSLVAGPVVAVTLFQLRDRALLLPAFSVLLCVVLVAGTYKLISAFPPRTEPLSQWLNRNGPDAPGYPCAAADYVESHVPPVTGHLINEFSWGGYLGWRLQDRFQILLDGRTQVFAAEVWQATYLGTDSDLANFLAEQQADAAVLPLHKGRFRDALSKLGWTSVFSDERSEVLLPPTSKKPITASMQTAR